MRDDAVYPEAVRQAEQDLVQQRRQQIDDAHRPLTDQSDTFFANGIGFSGGGIRSATFALGFSQALARAKLWSSFDFMSTVSGGGYFGAFLGRLFQQQRNVNNTEYALQDGAGIAHLRLYSRYLAPGGNDDGWAAAAIVLRNLFFVQALFFFFAVSGATLAVLLTHFGHNWSLVQQFGRVLPPVFLPATLFLLLTFLLFLFYFSLAINGSDFQRNGGQSAIAKLWYFSARLVLTLSLLVMLMAPLAAVGDQTQLVLAGISQQLLNAFVPALLLFIALMVLLNRYPQDETDLSAWRMNATRSLRLALMVFCVALLCAGVDFVAFRALRYIQALTSDDLQNLLHNSIAALLGGNLIITVGQKLLTALSASKNASGQLQALLMKLTLIVIASSILLCFVLIAFICAHALTFDTSGTYSLNYGRLVLVTVLALIAVGSVSAFANYTSMHSFYFSRLKRAWLRAATRDSAAPSNNTFYAPQVHDDIAIQHYQPHAVGGPIHFINCTINETVGQDTGLYQADRRGLALAVSSHLVSVGARHHLLQPWQKANAFSRYQLFGRDKQLGPDALTLGRWVAISGAAFSTGLGQATRWYYSLLAASLNVRLGFWWRARRNTGAGLIKPRLPWQLLQESLGMFYGTRDAHWYLSDGGHFENMAGYELIRRRLSRIVIVDAECDGQYQFGGMANLVHKARLDFSAEIRFLDDAEIAEVCGHDLGYALASLNALSHNGCHGGQRYRAALARVIYDGNLSARGFDDPQANWLLYIKPVVTGNESLDITQYKSDNPDFPQQTTIDQFFDERQWEAYRKLGEISGDELAALLQAFLLR